MSVRRVVGVGGVIALSVWAFAGQAAPEATALGPSASSSRPAWAAAGFVAYKCGGSICFVRPDGTGERALFAGSDPWPQWDATFSPDGRRVAFRGYYASADGAYALYLAHTSGCGVRRLTRSIAGSPSWSPDGKWIAFDTSGEGTIWKVHPDGSGLTRIAGAQGTDYDASPAWSPNGKTIAFVHYDHGYGQIWLVEADGGRPRLLHADAGTSDRLPAWSHDGTRIAFAAQAWPHAWIEVMNADGTNAHALTTKSGDASNPVWLPHDVGVAFLGRSTSTGNLFVIRTDGRAIHSVAHLQTDQFTWAATPLPAKRC